MLCSDHTKKLSRRVGAEDTETSHRSQSLTLASTANTDRLTPRALRYARRSGGLVEPVSQTDRRRNSSTRKTSTANTQSSVGTSKATDACRQRGYKRHSTETATSETPSKKAKKDSSKLTSSPSASLSPKPKQESVAKKQAASRRVVRTSADGHSSRNTSNLECGKGKASKGDKVSTKTTAGQPSSGATAVGHIATKRRLHRPTASTAASAEASSASATGDTATGGTSQSSHIVTRRAATKRGGTLLSFSSHLTDTTGSCASSK